MNRRRLKLVSALLALLMFISPIVSLAMQPAAPDSQASHCQEMDSHSESSRHGISDQATCTMENCAESCSSSRHCSSPAPIILGLSDVRNFPRARGFEIGRIPDRFLSIHLSGLYRPPRA